MDMFIVDDVVKEVKQMEGDGTSSTVDAPTSCSQAESETLSPSRETLSYGSSIVQLTRS